MAAILLLASCSTMPKAGSPAAASVTGGLDPSALVDPGAAIIMRADRAILDRLLPVLLGKDQAGALAPLEKGLKVASLALLRREGGAAAPGLPAFEAAFVGDFPVFRAKLALAFNKDWRLRKGIWTNSSLGLGLAFPRRDLIVLASGSPEALIERLKSGRPVPFPPALGELSDRQLACWIPDPFGRLGLALLGERLEIPSDGILMAANLKDGGYSAALAFQMRDAEAARVYRPAARLAWFALSRFLLPGEAGIASPRFELQDRAIVAGDIAISESGLSGALAKLGMAGN
jgi:hypothetical protein